MLVPACPPTRACVRACVCCVSRCARLSLCVRACVRAWVCVRVLCVLHQVYIRLTPGQENGNVKVGQQVPDHPLKTKAPVDLRLQLLGE